MSLELKNIFALIKLNRQYLARMIISLSFVMLFFLLLNHGWFFIEKRIFYSHYWMERTPAPLLLMLAFLEGLFLIYQFLRPVVGCFPGTSATRYTAACISSHILLAAILLLQFVYYLLELGLLQIISRTVHPLDTSFAFSWKYLGYSYCLLLFLFLLAFGVFHLCFQVFLFIQHLPAAVSLLLGIAFAVVCEMLLTLAGNRLLAKLAFFPRFAALALFIWLLSLVTGWFVSRHQKIWTDIPGIRIILFLLASGIMLFFFLLSPPPAVDSVWDQVKEMDTRELGTYLQRESDSLAFREYRLHADDAEEWLQFVKENGTGGLYNIDIDTKQSVPGPDEDGSYNPFSTEYFFLTTQEWNQLGLEDPLHLEENEILLRLYTPKNEKTGERITGQLLEHTTLCEGDEQTIQSSQRSVIVPRLVPNLSLYRGSEYEKLLWSVESASLYWLPLDLYDAQTFLVILSDVPVKKGKLSSLP